MENLVVSVEDGLSGTVIDMLAPRKGLMQNMSSENGLTTMEFYHPNQRTPRIPWRVYPRNEGGMNYVFSFFSL